MTNWPLICIGLGGIFEGYMPFVLLLWQTKIACFPNISLVDGKIFDAHHEKRQHVRVHRAKAEDRRDVWQAAYPDAPLRAYPVYLDPQNIGDFIADGSIVLLSPDNHATRRLVSSHVEQLQNVLLIAGGNDAIDRVADTDGNQGTVIVHCKLGGVDLTSPITVHHPEIREPTDRLPSTMGCIEQAQAGQPQILATNLAVGHAMYQMLHRYLVVLPEEAVEVVELWVNSREGTCVPYGIRERPLETP